MKTVIPLLICFIVSFSCQKKNVQPRSEERESFILTSDQNKELSALKLNLEAEKNQTEKSATSVSPNSDENYMDVYGLNLQNALLEANALNSTHDDHMSSELAYEKWSNDLSMKYQEGLHNITHKPNENVVFSIYAETIHDLYLEDFETSNNQNQLIAHTKIFERFVVKSNFLTLEEKDALLMEMALLKYSIYTAYEYGIIINGTNHSEQINAMTLWECVGQKVRNVYKKYGSTIGYLICISLGESFIPQCLAYLLIHG